MNDANPFEKLKPLPGVSPEDYARSFDEGFEPDRKPTLAPTGDPRVDELFKRRETPASEAWKRARGTVGDAFLVQTRKQGVGVAGAGLMGVSIAAAFLNAGFPVLLYDPFESARASACERVEREAAAQRARRGETPLESDRLEALLQTTARIDALAQKSVVVESTPEKLKLKAKFYRELNAAANAPILTLTNTSSLRVDELAETLPDACVAPERFAGFHFFHPVCKRNLLEIAKGTRTAPETLEKCALLARAIRKIPLVVGDGAGFLVNRLLQSYLNEALVMLDEGTPAEQIERACRRFGMEGAPLRVIDEIGVDVSMRAGWSFLKAFPDRTQISDVLPALVREGRLGRKTKRGFYRYESTNSWTDDATLDYERIDVERQENAATIDDETVVRRVLRAILDEAKRALDEGVVGSKREIDAGLVLALGFPQERGGAFYWELAYNL